MSTSISCALAWPREFEWRHKTLPACIYLDLGSLTVFPRQVYENVVQHAVSHCLNRLYIGVHIPSLADELLESALGWLYSVAVTTSQQLRDADFRTTILCSFENEDASSAPRRVDSHAASVDALYVLDCATDGTQTPILHIIFPGDSSELDIEDVKREAEISRIDTSSESHGCIPDMIATPRALCVIQELGEVGEPFQTSHNPRWHSVDLRDCLKLDHIGACSHEGDGLESKSSTAQEMPDAAAKEAKWPTVVMGGTLDRLHEGHTALLTIAAARALQRVIIGLSSGQLLAKKQHLQQLQPYALRLQILDETLKLCAVRPIDVQIEPLYDMYGPAGELRDLDCIVVSQETAKGGAMVNEYRKNKGLPELHIITGPLVQRVELAPLNTFVDMRTGKQIFMHDGELKQSVAVQTVGEKTSSTYFRQQQSLRQMQRMEKTKETWEMVVGMYNRCFQQRGVEATSDTARDTMKDAMWQRLLDLYNQPHRHYHTFNHIQELLAAYEKCLPLLPLDLAEKAIQDLLSRLVNPIAFMIILFHDAIYEPQRHDNEEASAALWQSFARDMSWPEELSTVVHRAILRTKTHTTNVAEEEVEEIRRLVSMCRQTNILPTNVENHIAIQVLQQVLALAQDLDMSILASPTELYIEYAYNIFAEYRHLGVERYVKGRTSVLETLLKSNIFGSYLASLWERAAQRNIRRELRSIQSWVIHFNAEFRVD